MTITLSDALATAANWLQTTEIECIGAFIGGSAATSDPAMPYSPTSDIDCYLVVMGEPPATKIGKIVIEGVLLDISWISWHQIEAAPTDAVIGSLLNLGIVVDDAEDRLQRAQRDIRKTFAHPTAVTLRLEDMKGRIRGGLKADSSDRSNPEQVMNWLFPATLTTHLPLVQHCVPLTVRKRFVAAKRVMSTEAYEELLALYGFADVEQDQAQRWLDLTADILAENADLAQASSRFWASDLLAPEIAIGGSQELINAGLHREALYWIIATSARCLTLRADAEVGASSFEAEFNHMLAELRLLTHAERSIRSDHILQWVEAFVDI